MRVVIVDDNTTNLAVLCALVGRMPGVDVEGFSDPRAALADAGMRACDLFVVDYVMPGINGLELVHALRLLSDHAHVPIVMITADGDRRTRLAAINAGATDFLARPVDPAELRLRVANLLALREAQNSLARRADHLAAEVASATRHLQDREEEVITRLARAIEFRDNETSEHVGRVARVAQIIAEELGQDADYVRTLFLAAPLHDVGKIGVPDAILNKPGKLDSNELVAMRRHVNIGARILADGDSELVRMAADIAVAHHEHWDGAGYPNNLAGHYIPLSARITAVADVFDALCSPRCYKQPWPIDLARAEILRGASTHFDPACVAAFQLGWSRIKPLFATLPVADTAA